MIKNRIIQLLTIVILSSYWSIVISQDMNEVQSKVRQWEVFLSNSLPRLMYDSNLIKVVEIIHLQNKIPIILADSNDTIILSNINSVVGKNINSEQKNLHSVPTIKTIHYNSKYLGSYFLQQPNLIVLNSQKYILLGIVSCLMLIALYSRRKYTADLSTIKGLLKYIRNDHYIMKKDKNASDYIQDLVHSVMDYKKRIKKYNNQLENKSKKEAAGEIARQVAHDIKSPLAALDMSLEKLSKVVEDDRIIIRSAITRIHDIANTLLEKNIPSLDKTQKKLENVLITGPLERIIAEKRTQYHHRNDLNMTLEIKNEAFELFSKVNPIEFKRVISNIINNSIESFENKSGKIKIIVEDINQFISIKIIDNGKGIPPEIIHKISNSSYSFNKAQGNGLGLNHAKKFISSLNGKFLIESEVGIGTSLALSIPKSLPPQWFCSNIRITKNMQILILDDDDSIHHIWKERFKDLTFNLPELTFFHFHNTKQIIDFISSSKFNKNNYVLLSDYELIGEKETGIDIINQYNLAASSYLITSYYEDSKIQKRCLEIGIKLIPKYLARKVPITMTSPLVNQKRCIVHLDNDELIRQIWKMKAKKVKNINFYSFANYHDLRTNLKTFPQETLFFLDQELSKEDPKGTEIAKILNLENFSSLYISTAHNKEDFQDIPYITDVIGKEFPSFI